jgi:hypothetical protein
MTDPYVQDRFQMRGPRTDPFVKHTSTDPSTSNSITYPLVKDPLTDPFVKDPLADARDPVAVPVVVNIIKHAAVQNRSSETEYRIP